MSGPKHATSNISDNKYIITLCTQTVGSQTCFRDLEGELRLLFLFARAYRSLERMHASLIPYPAPAGLRLESCKHFLPASEGEHRLLVLDPGRDVSVPGLLPAELRRRFSDELHAALGGLPVAAELGRHVGLVQEALDVRRRPCGM